MTEMLHEQASQLLGVFALHAMEDDERLAVAAHVDVCEDCRLEVNEHFEIVSLLVGDGEELPEGLWNRLSSELDGDLPPLRAIDDLPAPRRRSKAMSFLVAATSAAAVLVLVTAGSLIYQTNRLNYVEDNASSPSLSKVAAAAAKDPSNRRISLVSADGKYSLDGVIDEAGWVYVTKSSMPAAGAGHAYQLWAVANGQPISVGMMGSEPHAGAYRLPASTTALAVTDEVSQGVVVSAQPAIVKGSISA